VIPCHQLSPLQTPSQKRKWPIGPGTARLAPPSGIRVHPILQNNLRNSPDSKKKGKEISDLLVRCQEPNGTCLSLRPPKPQTKSIHHTDLRKKKQRYVQTEMKLYLMPSSTGRLMIPKIPRMINCQGRQAPNQTQGNLGSTAMIYETTTPMPVLCPPISFTVEERSHYKLKAAGRVCYSEVTYHSNSRYKKRTEIWGMKMAKG